MIYLDSSCLVKLLTEEPETEAVQKAIKAETLVVISSLAELESEVRLKAAVEAGLIRTSQWRHYQAKLAAMRNIDPFHFKELPASTFTTALQQHRKGDAVYCRSLDRLHLAAMEELKMTRLMTLDERQAKAAEGLSFRVVRPGKQDL